MLPRWVGDGQEVAVSDAPTILGGRFGYRLVHRAATRTLQIDVSQPPPDRVSLVYPCCFGSSVRSATADGRPIQVDGRDVLLPARTRSATVTYL